MKKPFNNKKMIQNWFGDRGEDIKQSWIQTWFVHGDYLYIQWNEKTPYHLKPDEPFDVNWVNWKSLYFEWEAEGFMKEEKDKKVASNVRSEQV